MSSPEKGAVGRAWGWAPDELSVFLGAEVIPALWLLETQPVQTGLPGLRTIAVNSCCFGWHIFFPPAAFFFFGLYFNDVFMLLIIYSHTHSVCHWHVGSIGSFWLRLLIVSGCAAGRWVYLSFEAFPEGALEELEETRHLGSLFLVAFFIRYVKQLIGTCLFLGSRESGMDVQQLRWTCAFWHSVGERLC